LGEKGVEPLALGKPVALGEKGVEPLALGKPVALGEKGVEPLALGSLRLWVRKVSSRWLWEACGFG